MNQAKLLGFLLILVCFSNMVKADWPVGKKRLVLSPSYNYSSTSSYFDQDGKVRNAVNGGQFTSKGFGLYGATGVSRRVDLFFSVPMSFINSSDIFSEQTKTGVGDVMVGASFHTPSENLKKYFTLKAQLIIPAYSNLTSPYLGYGSKGAQIAANYSFLPKKGNFAVFEGSVARYFDFADGPTQLGFNTSYGFELPKFQSITLAFNHLSSFSSNKIFSTNLNSNKDYMMGRLSGSYGRRISRTITPYIQLSYSVYGRNVGRGLSASVFCLVRLP